MRRTVVIYILFATASFFLPQCHLHGKDGWNTSRLEYGVEWGMQMPVATKLECSFLTTDRYIVTMDEHKVGNHINGMFSVFAGYDVSKRINISISIGYLGLTKGERGVSTTFRGTYRISSQAQADAGSRVFAECGVFRRKGNDRTSVIAKAGYGYRFALNRDLSFDIRCGVMSSRSHPDIYDKYSGCTVSHENLRSLRNVNIGPFVTLALAFGTR